MSEEANPENPIPESANPEPAPPPREEAARLQRQTFVMVNDRGRMVILVALCTLAGVGVGFGLATLVGQRAPCDRTSSRPPVVFEQAIPNLATPLLRGFHQHGGERGHGCGGRHGVHIWDGDEGVHIWDDAAGVHMWTDDGDGEVGYLGIDVAVGDPGPRVVGVAAESPAAAAGLKVDDLVVEFDGEKVEAPNQLVRLVRGGSPGDRIALSVQRAGVARQVEVVLASLAERVR